MNHTNETRNVSYSNFANSVGLTPFSPSTGNLRPSPNIFECPGDRSPVCWTHVGYTANPYLGWKSSDSTKASRVRLSGVSDPPAVFVCIDGRDYVTRSDWADYNVYVYLNDPRHTGGLNILYTDGHAAYHPGGMYRKSEVVWK